MKVTCRSLLMYILSAVLVIGYILILLRSLMPKTSWEYELYYIEHETARWAGLSGFDYTLGTPLKMTPTDPNTNYRFDAGWGDFTEEGCWTNAETSTIYFDNLPERDLTLSVQVAQVCVSDRVEVYCNGTLAASIPAAQIAQDGGFSVPISAAQIPEGRLKVALTMISPTQPAEDASLGLLCNQVVLYETENS